MILVIPGPNSVAGGAYAWVLGTRRARAVIPLSHQEAESDQGFWTQDIPRSDPIHTAKISWVMAGLGLRVNGTKQVASVYTDAWLGTDTGSTLLNSLVGFLGQPTQVMSLKPVHTRIDPEKYTGCMSAQRRGPNAWALIGLGSSYLSPLAPSVSFPLGVRIVTVMVSALPNHLASPQRPSV